MKSLTPRLLPVSFTLALVLLTAAMALAALPGASSKPLSENQVLGLLQGGVANQRIEQLVRSRGIDFSPSNKILKQLQSAGARSALLNVLQAASQTLSPQAEAFANNREEAARYQARGQEFLDRKLWSEAEAELRQAVQLDPTNPAAHFYLAHALMQEKEWDGAIAEYREALILAPDSAAAHSNLGGALLAKRDFKDAVAEYRAALELSPADETAHYGLAVALYDEGKWPESVTQFRAAVRLAPKQENVRCALGLALLQENDVGGAIRQYQEALRLNPHSAPAHAGLGYALLKKGDRQKALEEYRAAAALSPRDLSLRASYQALWRQLNP